MTSPAGRVGRIALEPLLVRLGVLAASVTALVVAIPAGLPPLVTVALVVAAGLPAAFPHGPWATLVAVAAAAGWVVEPGPPTQLVLLAAVLYLLHTLTALAATLPYDARVDPDVLTRWLVRSAGVLVAASVLVVAVLIGQSWRGAAGSQVVATVAGLALAMALVYSLAGRRRRPEK